MSNEIRRFLDFGEFTFDLTNNALLREQRRVDLPPLAVAVLRYLLENRDRCISKSELLEKIWHGTAVGRDSVYQQIGHIREALGDSSHQIIQNRPKFGWQFVAAVSERAEVTRAAAGATRNSSVEAFGETAASYVQENEQAAQIILHGRAGLIARAPGSTHLRIVSVAIIVAAATAISTLAVIRKPAAQVLSFTQLTNDGKPKYVPILTDSRKIFFVELIGGSRRLVYIPASGGEAVPLDIPLSQFSLQDISADGAMLLLHSTEAGENTLWTYSISSGSLRPFRTGFAQAAWAQDGSMLAASDISASQLLILRRATEAKTGLPGRIRDLKWAPDGKKLRFSLLDAKRDSSSEWELDERGGQPQRLSSISDGQEIVGSGSWSRDARYFFYSAGSFLRQDIWVVRESDGLSDLGSHRPARLTQGGPGSWDWPIPSADPSIVFALNRVIRSELVRFDGQTNSWQPEWDDTSAFELDFTKDRNCVVYTRLPDHTIWRARPDGTARIQLTGATLEAHQPHWSPDGSRVAFMARKATGQWRIFQVPVEGGKPEELLPEGEDQGVPSWSPNGQLIMFGDLQGRRPKAEMSIHLLNLETRKASALAGSKGLWSPRWSHNGRYIAAVTADSQAIRILPWKGMHWTELARMAFVDNATWSADSSYIYFNGSDMGGHKRLLRVAVPDGRPERIADLDSFPDTPENWYGVTPDGTPLASRGMAIPEIFALKCVLP